jgi:hypothetical protein
MSKVYMGFSDNLTNYEVNSEWVAWRQKPVLLEELISINNFVLSYPVWFMVFNATFNNISAISWRSILMVEETGVPGENHRPVKSHWQTLSFYDHLAMRELDRLSILCRNLESISGWYWSYIDSSRYTRVAV